MSRIIVPRRDLILPSRYKQRGFIMNPYRFGGSGGGSDPHWANVSSLLHFDAALTDQKGKGWSGAGNAQISTAQSKFGGSSLLLDGSGDYIGSAAHADFDFNAGDFTVEFFIRFNSLATYQSIVSRNYNVNGGFLIQASITTGRIYVLNWEVGAQNTLVEETTGSYSTGVWYHIAAVRSGSTVRLFRDGVATATGSAGSANIGSPTASLYVGAGSSGGGTPTNYFVNGHIDEFRITKGVARYTSNFTPPTAPFPNS